VPSAKTACAATHFFTYHIYMIRDHSKPPQQILDYLQIHATLWSGASELTYED